MTQHLTTAFILICALMGCTPSPLIPKDIIEPEVYSEAPFNVLRAGDQITVLIKAPQNTAVSYHWKDFKNQALSLPVSLPINQKTTLSLPKTDTGYYGLVLQTKGSIPFSGRQKGEPREYGFASLHETAAKTKSSPFGTVHSDLSDPYIPSWVKTMTWHTAPAQDWTRLIATITDHKKFELPILVGEGWASDDSRPISEDDLVFLYQKALSYFKATPELSYWETGIEENLQDTYEKPYYWKNLERKVITLKQAAKDAKADIKFIYQIVGMWPEGIETFYQHKAYRYVDIISLHPYAWPDFPAPDTWLPQLLDRIKTLQKKHNTTLPVWMTEVGAPHFGNYQGGFFGYPKDNNKTGGLSRENAAAYLVKLCTIARAKGIEKIFWYNYKDQGPSREDVEDHFGLMDYWGFPKPAYAAYNQLVGALQEYKGVRLSNMPQDITAYRFKKVVVLWGQKKRTINLVALGLVVNSIKEATGSPLPYSNAITIGPTPLFLYLN